MFTSPNNMYASTPMMGRATTTATHAMRDAGSRCGRNIARTSTAISNAAVAASVIVVIVIRIRAGEIQSPAAPTVCHFGNSN